MFVSIPAETVAASSKVLVSLRSLQVEVSLSEVRRVRQPWQHGEQGQHSCGDSVLGESVL